MWDSRESGSGSRNACEAEVGPAVVYLRKGIAKMATSFCLDLGREALLGRRVGRTVDACIGQDPRSEIGLSF